VLLPEQFVVRFKPSADSLDGAIYLDHAGTANVICEPSVKHSITREGDSYRIDLFADKHHPAKCA